MSIAAAYVRRIDSRLVNTPPDLQLALDLADAADAVTMARYGAEDLQVTQKPDDSPVTEVDRAVEQLIRERLLTERPDDAILGEEFGATAPGQRTWIIDPIDGTKNYLRRVPVWATLIGLREGDVVTVGVVSAPALGRRWWAATGFGAWMNEPAGTAPRRLQVSSVRELADASFSYSDTIDWPVGVLDDIRAATWRQRGYGDFWSHVLVAEGAVDFAAEPDLQPYDIAGFVPIVTEAGGMVTGWNGGDPLISGSAVSTNGHLHNQVVVALNP
jgi:histidinol-phosphatase